MKGKYKIINEYVRDNVIRIIRELPFDKVHEVQLHPYKYDRTEAQKGYYFRIVGIMAPDLGYRKDELHDMFKYDILHQIFMADDEMKDYHEKVHALSHSMIAGTMSGEMCKKMIAELASTNKAKLKHMSALIEEVHHLAANHEIRLPVLEHER